jgi:hypothetical protein
MSEKTGLLSCGVVLINPKSELLVIKRPFSYAVSSFFSLLLLRETKADRPDQVEAICRRLLPECSPSELKFLKANWKSSNLQTVLDWYIRGLSANKELLVAADHIEREFVKEAIKVRVIWNLLVDKIDLAPIESTGKYRIHDFPKSRHCKSWRGALVNFTQETGIELPDNLDYKRVVSTSYSSEMGTTYELQLFISESPSFKIRSNYVGWVSREDLKIHDRIAEVL